MSKSCEGLLNDYVACLERSACVATEGRAVKACAADATAAPECKAVREVRAATAAAARACAHATRSGAAARARLAARRMRKQPA